MDPLDFAIYRYLSPGGEARFWAGRRIVDPRVTSREIAERVGISESGTRARLRRLAQHGYLRDRRVTPNPSLFGERIFVAELRVGQPGEAHRILRDLGLVEGAVFARDLMDETERRIQVYLAASAEPAAQRRARLVARLASLKEVPTLRPYYIPPHTSPPSPTDWKVLRAVWQRPDSSITELARAVGVGQRTATRSYRSLLERNVCWWTHGPDAEEFPLAFVRLELSRPSYLDGVAGWLADSGEPWMPVARDGYGFEPQDVSSTLAGLVPADAPTGLERFLRSVAEVDGVDRVYRTFPLGSAAFPAWASERLTPRDRTRT